MPEFNSSLKMEEKASEKFNDFYKTKWNVNEIEVVNEKGRDKKLLVDSEIVFIEEKIRDSKFQEKKDIVIEEISNDCKQSDGWIYYCNADFLVYSWFPVNEILLFNVNDLRNWFLKNKEKYELRFSETEGFYKTFFRIIPLADLNELFSFSKAEHWFLEKGEWIKWIY